MTDALTQHTCFSPFDCPPHSKMSGNVYFTFEKLQIEDDKPYDKRHERPSSPTPFTFRVRGKVQVVLKTIKEE